MLDFDSVQAALQGLGANQDAGEAHGTLCALLLGDATLATWLGHTLDELPEPGNVLAAENLAVLEQLFEETRGQFDDETLAFELLLPDESDDFGIRLLAVAGWCQGFLYGFGLLGSETEEKLDAEGRECLSDLLEISKLSHDEEASEEAEQQFAEIVEHLRMSVLLLNETLNPLPSSSVVH